MDAVDPQRLLGEIRDGASVVLDSFEDHCTPVQQMCQALQEVLRCPVDAYVFITPPGETGLERHYDIKDVFALQIIGQKDWKVWEQLNPVPDDGRVLPGGEAKQPEVDVRLAPGDVLYMPKGTPHIASASTGLSVHISFAARPATYRMLVQQTLTDALAGSEFDAVPQADGPDLQGRLRGKLQELAMTVMENGNDEVAAPPMTSHSDLPEALRGLVALAAVTGFDGNIRRVKSIAHETRSDGKVSVTTGDLKLILPPSVEPVIALLESSQELETSKLLGMLGLEHLRLLLSRLVAHGVLQVAPTET